MPLIIKGIKKLNRLLKVKNGSGQTQEGKSIDEGEQKKSSSRRKNKKVLTRWLDMNLVNVSRINEIMINDLVDAYKRLLE